jgi:MFS family permease
LASKLTRPFDALAQAASLLLGRKGRICMWIARESFLSARLWSSAIFAVADSPFLASAVALAVYIYSLDGTTTYLYLAKATSVVFKHSLLGTISTAGAIIIAVGKPLMAKLADYIGRGETFIVVTVFYCVGYILYATANDVYQIAGGQIIYSFGALASRWFALAGRQGLIDPPSPRSQVTPACSS